jgi:hypothetical protein
MCGIFCWWRECFWPFEATPAGERGVDAIIAA